VRLAGAGDLAFGELLEAQLVERVRTSRGLAREQPFDHLAGVHAAPIDDEKRDDYRRLSERR
jgi:hypothetical protein